MPTVHDCVSQTDRAILSPLLKSYNATTNNQPRQQQIFVLLNPGENEDLLEVLSDVSPLSREHLSVAY